MARGRWQRYADDYGVQLGDLINRAIRRTLVAGIRAAVANTVHDSSRAASHWVILPNDGPVRPGAWREMTFNPAYGRPPVGHRGDKGAHAAETEAFVVDRENTRTIQAAVQGRRPATRFLFENATPARTADSRKPGGSYRDHAKLARAQGAAEAAMQQRFHAALTTARGNLRKRPLR